MLSPERTNPFESSTGNRDAAKGGNLLPAKRSYYDIMTEQ